MKVRYTGAGPDALMLCKDKALAKKLLVVPPHRVARFVVSPRARPLQAPQAFVYPAFVKPVGEESCDGIAQASFAKTRTRCSSGRVPARALRDGDALIEEYIEGRELYLASRQQAAHRVSARARSSSRQLPRRRAASSPRRRRSGTTRTGRNGASRTGRPGAARRWRRSSRSSPGGLSHPARPGPRTHRRALDPARTR